MPRRGFCSFTPGSDVLLSGNGAMSIETACDPYSEQILFRHESLFTPHKPSEAPNIAGIFPQVKIEDGIVTEMDGVPREEFDLIDQFIANSTQAYRTIPFLR